MKSFSVLILLLIMQGINANPALDDLNTILNNPYQANLKTVTKGSSELVDLQSHYELVFIYRSDCPHCHNFAPILDDFSRHFKIKIKAYSVDGGSLSPFKGEPLSPELFRTFFLSGGFKPMVPALFLLNQETNQAYPVLFGEAEPYQLASRIEALVGHIKEQFNDEA